MVPSDKQEAIIDGIVKEFAGLAAHPRKSGHEKAVSDYLAARLRSLGATVHQDAVNNIIADVPATKGCEKVPLTLLQGHMDMVCVAKPGVKYDPLKDPIKLVREGNVLHADGTSLGADDGMAAAIFLYLLQQDFAHGPLRLIFTVDEEVHMTGSMNLDPKWVRDATYVINCDSESLDTLVVASAGSVHTDFTRKVQKEADPYDGALEVTARKFIGGHSGETINQGKSNAIKALAQALERLTQAGVPYRLVRVEGGAAANAIPSEARAVIALPQEKIAEARKLVAAEEASQKAVYGAVEKTLAVTAEETAVPGQVWSQADTSALVDLLVLLHTGVFAMNQHLSTLPDLSANIGTLRETEQGVDVEYFPRSSSNERLEEFVGNLPVFARVTGFQLQVGKLFSAWTENLHSRLLPVMQKVHKAVLGKDARVEAMHGGLETGFFYAMDPQLDLVSVGPNTHAIHSADESVDLDTCAQLARIIAETLEELTK
jgi:dipeptidase D